MREEPVIPRGLLKLLGALLAVAALGGGTYALVTGVDLPDLPEISTEPPGATTIERGSFEQTELGGEQARPQAVDPFTSAGFAAALGAVRDRVGARADLTQVAINPVETQFHIRRGEQAEGLSYPAGGGELSELEVRVVGTGSLKDSDFPLAAVQAGAVDRIARSVRRASDSPDVQIDVITLERAFDGNLRWVIIARDRSRILSYEARVDGRGLGPLGGGSAPPEIPIPSQARKQLDDARRALECVQRARSAEELAKCAP